MKAALAPLTEKSYWAVCGGPPERTLWGFSVERDGKPLLIAGMVADEGRNVLIARFTPEMRAQMETMEGKRIIVMGARQVKRMVESSPLPVESHADPRFPKASGIIEHIGGFRPIGGDWWRHPGLMRTKVLQAERVMRETGTPVEIPVTHHWANKGTADGVYGREIKIPAGALVTGKTHRTEQINVLLEGVIRVLVGERVERLAAPQVVVSPAGTKRIAYAETDVRWLTVHATPETDLEVIERHFIEPDDLARLGAA